MSFWKRVSLLALCVAASQYAGAQTAVTTHHYDNARTGDNLGEVILTPSNVNPQQFGLLFSWPVDASVYAQPLYVPGVAVTGKGTHNVVYIATMNDSVYAFDADSNTGADSTPLWQVNYTNAAAGITAVPSSDVELANEQDISGPIGIEGTPVINLSANAMYFVARTKENGSYVQRLHAIDIRSGADLTGSPVVISATVTAAGNTIAFNPKLQNQRAALTYANNLIYVAWGSHNDIGPYYGWMMAFSPTTLALTNVYNDTPAGSQGGIWQAGSGPAVDSSGNLYVGSGNGNWNGTTDFGQSVVKLSPSLAVTDYFTPDNWQTESANDVDLGCGGLLLIPGTSLVLEGSKEYILYLLNTANMGHMVTGNTQIPQLFQATTGHIHSGPTYYNSPVYGPLIYIWAENDYLKAFHFNGTTLDTTPLMQSSFKDPVGMAGGFSTLSANGSTVNTAVLWESLPLNGDAAHAVVPGAIRAFDANNLSKELWDSNMLPDRDAVGMHAKDVPPLVMNGKVYEATFSNKVNVYGGFSTAASLTESLSAATVATAPGATASLQASISATSSFSGTVYFAVSGLPTGATAQFLPSTVVVPTASSTTLTVNVPATVAAGSYTVTVTESSGVFSSAQTFTLVVEAATSTASLSGLYNVVGITNDTAPSYGNVDGAGDSLSSTLVPATVSAGGVSFTTGPTTNGTSNAISAAGQTIPLTAGYYASVNFIGFGVNGNQAGAFTLTYSDGTTTTASVNTSNWTLGPQYGEAVALSMAYRNTKTGKQTGSYYVYQYSLTANAAKQLKSVTLPANSNLILLAMTAAAPSQAASSYTAVLQVSAGGKGSGTFVADIDYSGGTTDTVTNTINTSNVTNPAPAAVYQSERWGNMTYTFSGLAVSTQYLVRLHFAETYWSAAGQRVFNVLLNGTTVLSNFDIVARAGAANTALVEQFTVNSGTAGSIVAAFQNGPFDNAKIDGIEILLPAAATTTTTPVQISAGGTGSGSFVADEYFSGGKTATVTNTIDTSLALFPAPTAVYQSERWGPMTYTIPNLTAGGSYWVRLHFAETYWNATGKRIFNVLINGTTVLSNFDIMAAAGSNNRAISKQFTATANTSGQIVIQFVNGSADNAKIDGIEVIAAPATGSDAALFINSGGGASGSFVADADYAGGTAASTGNTISTSGVTNPAPLAVYQTERWGAFTYTFTGLAAGTSHTVRLHFAEFYWSAVGQRTFSITANGATVLSNYDIVKAAGGANKAIVVQFVTTADQNGNIALNFLKSGADNPKVSGIEIH